MTEPHPHPDQLIAYALSEVDAGERAAIDTHIAGCASCGTQARDLDRVLEAERNDAGRAPTRVLIELFARQQHRRHALVWRRPVLGVVTLGTAVVLFVAGHVHGRRAASPRATAIPSAQGSSVQAPVRAPLPAPPRIPLEDAKAPRTDLAFVLWEGSFHESTTVDSATSGSATASDSL